MSPWAGIKLPNWLRVERKRTHDYSDVYLAWRAVDVDSPDGNKRGFVAWFDKDRPDESKRLFRIALDTLIKARNRAAAKIK